MNRGRLLGWALFLMASLTSAQTWADTYRARPIEIGTSIGYETHPCPCVRVGLQVQLASGEWESRSLWVSLESLYSLDQTNSPFLNEVTSRMHKLGAAEAVWKPGLGKSGIGIGFSGLRFGENVDAGYTDVLTTGVYALLQIYRSQALGLDVKSGYAYRQFRVNEGPELNTHEWSNGVAFRWNTGRWSGKIDLTAYDWDDPRYQGSVETHVTTHRYAGVQMGIGAEVLFEHDPAREAWGLDMDQEAVFLNLDLLWETRR